MYLRVKLLITTVKMKWQEALKAVQLEGLRQKVHLKTFLMFLPRVLKQI
jgi:hypothetical protein